MKHSFFLAAILAITLFACKEEPINPALPTSTFDTIFPKSYLPVYPNSWWKYEINGNTTITTTVSNKYQLHSYRISENNSWTTQAYSDTVYVPFFESKPIYGYEKIEWIKPPFGDYYTKWPILSETVGFKFDRDWEDKRYDDFAEKVEVKQKIFNGHDSILILEGHWVYGPNINNKRQQEYIKGVGLSKDLLIDTVNSDTIYKKVLIDYFISN